METVLIGVWNGNVTCSDVSKLRKRPLKSSGPAISHPEDGRRGPGHSLADEMKMRSMLAEQYWIECIGKHETRTHRVCRRNCNADSSEPLRMQFASTTRCAIRWMQSLLKMHGEQGENHRLFHFTSSIVYFSPIRSVRTTLPLTQYPFSVVQCQVKFLCLICSQLFIVECLLLTYCCCY